MTNLGEEDLERIRKFLETLTAYFSVRPWPSGFFHTVGKIRGELENLNSNIEKAITSSEKLTKALNKITLAGVIISSFGVAISLAYLCFEVFKFIKSQ